MVIKDKSYPTYSNTTKSKRKQFIKRVVDDKITILNASIEFGIKFSTAKYMLKVYKQEGRIGKKKFRIREDKLLGQNQTKFKLKSKKSSIQGQQQQCDSAEISVKRYQTRSYKNPKIIESEIKALAQQESFEQQQSKQTVGSSDISQISQQLLIRTEIDLNSKTQSTYDAKNVEKFRNQNSKLLKIANYRQIQ